MIRYSSYGCLFIIGLVFFAETSCVHDPIFASDDEPMPMDSMILEVDTMDCDPTLVNFSKDILPLLQSNCALSGCHDQTTHEEDIILVSFESVMASDVVEPMDAADSELYEVLVETDNDKRMPPPPAGALTSGQIELLRRWIDEGAVFQLCLDTIPDTCVITNMRYAIHVGPVIESSCRSCHSGATPAGDIDLSAHMGVQQIALNGKLIGAVDHQNGYVPMPQGLAKLEVCTIDQINSWIIDGALNN